MYRIILAISKDGYIADINGNIPWHISKDFKWFKMNTYNSTIIMGRKTWETLKKPLPHRMNCVISSNDISCDKQFYGAYSAKKYLKKNNAWIIGGKIAEYFFTSGTIIFLTYVDKTVNCGVHINLPKMKRLWTSENFTENNSNFKFTINKII